MTLIDVGPAVELAGGPTVEIVRGGAVVEVIVDEGTVIEFVGASAVIEIGLGGLTGPQGVAGPAGTTFVKVAGAALSGHRVVTPAADGEVSYANNSDLAIVEKPLWLTMSAVADGADVIVQTFGEITEPSWAWTPGEALFLGLNGLMTHAPPAAPALVLVQVGSAVTATTIFFNPQWPVILAP